ncbi:MAG: hypothetical protein Q7R98_00340 [Candidatus Jorgensenbacteria bacterium]|nr:hypothetical protein [Candidatus Jorgensenbacteria bacterium]
MEGWLIITFVLSVGLVIGIVYFIKNWKTLPKQGNDWIVDGIDLEIPLPEILTDPVVNNPYFKTNLSAEEIPREDTDQKSVPLEVLGGKITSCKMPKSWKPNIVVLKKDGRRKHLAMVVSKNRRETKVIISRRSGKVIISTFCNQQITAM